jgi:hypothetical protein
MWKSHCAGSNCTLRVQITLVSVVIADLLFFIIFLSFLGGGNYLHYPLSPAWIRACLKGDVKVVILAILHENHL